MAVATTVNSRLLFETLDGAYIGDFVVTAGALLQGANTVNLPPEIVKTPLEIGINNQPDGNTLLIGAVAGVPGAFTVVITSVGAASPSGCQLYIRVPESGN